MIKISLKGRHLQIDATEDREILSGVHRAFFELAAGYERDAGMGFYFLKDARANIETLAETIEYLKESRKSFTLDDGVNQILDEIETTEESFEFASREGIAVKKQAATSLKIPHFKRKLKPYQVRSVQHLISVFHGANFSVPGSGKTTIVYAAYALLRKQGIVEKLFVVGPQSCFMPWEEEYLQCFGETARSARLTEGKLNRRMIYEGAEDYDLFLCTYHTLPRDLAEIKELCRNNKVMVVLDESHNIKRFEGGTWSEAVLEIARYATRRVILSGTPAPNNLEDIWTQMTFLWPDKHILDTRDRFAIRLKEKRGVEQIRKAIKPFFIRIQKNELMLPKQNFNRVIVEMNPNQANVYKALSIRILAELSLAPEDVRKLREWRKAKMVRLLQAASNPTLLTLYSDEFDIPPQSGEGMSVLQILEKYPRFETPAKFEKVKLLTYELVTSGQKVIIWTAFRHNIEMLRKMFQDLDPLRLYGAIPADASENEELNREQQLRLFRDPNGPAVLLANPAACAESISLHKICRHAIYLDRTFDCGRYMQSLDRIHRIGLAHDEEVNYYILKCSSTIDETIDDRLLEKESAMKELLEDTEIPIGAFDLPEKDKYALGREEEEEEDFNATVRDLKRHYKDFAPS